MLGKVKNWLLKIISIPPEFIIENSQEKIIVDEEFGRCLLKDQIQVTDLDSGFNGNIGDEIVVNLLGPSDDPEELYLGFNNNKKFVNLFSIPSNQIVKSKLNESKILINSTIRKDLHGTSFFNQEYLYDTIEKELYEVPNLILNLPREFQYTSTKDIPVYYDARSAVLQTKLGQINSIPVDIKVIFIKFYRAEAKGSVQIKFKKDNKEIEGWIPQEYSNSDYFTGMSAAD